MKPLLCSKPHDDSPCLFEYKANPSSDLPSSHDCLPLSLWPPFTPVPLTLCCSHADFLAIVTTFASHGPIPPHHPPPPTQIKQFSISYPLQYSCLENLMGRGAWRATVHRLTKSRTQLSTNSCTSFSPGDSVRSPVLSPLGLLPAPSHHPHLDCNHKPSPSPLLLTNRLQMGGSQEPLLLGSDSLLVWLTELREILNLQEQHQLL